MGMAHTRRRLLSAAARRRRDDTAAGPATSSCSATRTGDPHEQATIAQLELHGADGGADRRPAAAAAMA
jgi:hypothetical protein